MKFEDFIVLTFSESVTGYQWRVDPAFRLTFDVDFFAGEPI